MTDRSTYGSRRARLVKRFEGVPQAVQLALQPVLRRSAEELVALARRLAPEDHGELRESIRIEEGDHPLALRVVAGDDDAFYARWVEFGTAQTPQQAFLFPAYRLLKPRIQRRIDRAVRKAIRDYWNAR